MTEKIKTGLCVLALLLSLLLAYAQEMAYRNLSANQAAAQPAPVAAVQMN